MAGAVVGEGGLATLAGGAGFTGVTAVGGAAATIGAGATGVGRLSLAATGCSTAGGCGNSPAGLPGG
jgi:hypothetical protein